MKFQNFKAFSLLAIVTLMTFTLVHPSSHHHNHKRNTHRTRAARKQESEKEIRARKNSNSLFFSFSCFNGKLLRSCKYEEEKFSCASKRAWIFLPSNFLNRFHIFIFSVLRSASKSSSFLLSSFLFMSLSSFRLPFRGSTQNCSHSSGASSVQHTHICLSSVSLLFKYSEIFLLPSSWAGNGKSEKGNENCRIVVVPFGCFEMLNTA